MLLQLVFSWRKEEKTNSVTQIIDIHKSLQAMSKLFMVCLGLGKLFDQ